MPAIEPILMAVLLENQKTIENLSTVVLARSSSRREILWNSHRAEDF